MSVEWRCNRADVDPIVADDIDGLLGPSAYAWAVYYGLRTAAEQAALYAQGRTTPGAIVTNAPPGRSAHEHGLAVDVCILVGGHEEWDYTDGAWPWLWGAVLAHPRLHSGHRFPEDTHGIVAADNDHVESTRWPAVRAQLQASGNW